jgi:ribosome-binding factor A
MESKRQQKFAKLIQKDLSDIFQKDVKSLFGNAFITITEVKMTPDLGQAKIYLSFMLAPNKESLLDDIREKSKSIRQMLGNRIRNQARIIPELSFFIDDSIEYAAKMNELISGLNIPPASKEPRSTDEEE